MHPGLAAVAGTVQTTARACCRRINAPRRAPRVPRGSEKNVGILGCNGQIRSSNVRSLFKHLAPSRAAVAGLVNPALRVGCIRMSQGGDVHYLRIPRVDDDFTDLLGIAKSDVAPGRAAIGRFVNTIS